jgi:hypothetical protein
MTTTTLTQPVATAPTTTGIQRRPLLAVVLAHLSVDMQTGSLAVLLPLLLKAFALDYIGAAAMMSFCNLFQSSQFLSIIRLYFARFVYFVCFDVVVNCRRM